VFQTRRKKPSVALLVKGPVKDQIIWTKNFQMKERKDGRRGQKKRILILSGPFQLGGFLLLF